MNDKCKLVVSNNQENFMSEVNVKPTKEAEGALLIGDGNPLWLLNIFSSLAESTDAQEKGLLAVLYIIMYESGFYFLDGPLNRTISYDIHLMRCLNDPCILLQHMKKEDSKYVTIFSHKLIFPKLLKVVSYTLSSDNYLNDPVLVVNFLLPKENVIKTYLFSIKKYIAIDYNKGPLILRENTKLSLTIKNFLFSFNCSISEETYHPHHILSLPLHILQSLCCYLDGKSFVKFILTCKFLYETFSDDETLWKYYSLNEFKGLNKVQEEKWKAHYKYQSKKSKAVFFQLPHFITHPYSVWW